MRRPYHVVWWDDPEVDFELSTPCWSTGARVISAGRDMTRAQYSMNAAVMAESEEDAKEQILRAYVYEATIEWQFIYEKPFGWSPLNKNSALQPGVVWDQKPH